MTSPLLCFASVRWFFRYPLCCFTVFTFLDSIFLSSNQTHCCPFMFLSLFALRWKYLSWWRIIEIWQARLQHPGDALRLRGSELNWKPSERSSGHCQPCPVKGEGLVLVCTDCLWGFWHQVGGKRGLKSGLRIAERSLPPSGWGFVTSCPTAGQVTLKSTPLTTVLMWLTAPGDFNCKQEWQHTEKWKVRGLSAAGILKEWKICQKIFQSRLDK